MAETDSVETAGRGSGGLMGGGGGRMKMLETEKITGETRWAIHSVVTWRNGKSVVK